MNQDEINRQEWQNPENWSGPKWMSLYFSKRDSRAWVPKQIPKMGWTINLGNPAGPFWLVGFLVGIPVLIILICILIMEGIK